MKLAEAEIRDFAKDADIKRAGNKKLETLLEELKEAGFTDIELKEPMPEPKAEVPDNEPEVAAKPHTPAPNPLILEPNANPKDWVRVLMIKGAGSKAPHRLWVPERYVEDYRANGYQLVDG